MFALLAVVCPPLAVLLTAGPADAAKNTGLTLLLYFPGMLHARAAVERYTVARRYEALGRAIDSRAALPVTPRAA